MADVIEQSTAAPAPEQLPAQDMERVVEAFQTHRERPEMAGANAHEVLREAIKTVAPPAPQQASSPQTDDDANNVLQDPLPDYAKNATAQTKQEIEYLLTAAFTKGLDAANEEARKSHAFVIDAFHDALVGKLMPELKKRGLLH